MSIETKPAPAAMREPNLAPMADRTPLTIDEPEDSLFILDDLDLADEAELRRIVAAVENLARPPGARGLRVSVLTQEQWETVLQRRLPPAMKRGAAHFYMHVMRDAHESQHMLVSPSAVQGVNEGNHVMYQDVVYCALRCLATELSDLMRRGIDDIIAQAAAKELGVGLYTRNYLRETEFVADLISVLSDQFGYSDLEWAIELRRRPRRALIAVTKTNFGAFWAERTGAKASAELVDLLVRPKLDFEMDDIAATEATLAAYLAGEGETKPKEGAK